MATIVEKDVAIEAVSDTLALVSMKLTSFPPFMEGRMSIHHRMNLQAMFSNIIF